MGNEEGSECVMIPLLNVLESHSDSTKGCNHISDTFSKKSSLLVLNKIFKIKKIYIEE